MRRYFLPVLIAVAIAGCARNEREPSTGDGLLLTGAKIWTGDPQRPWASWVLIRGGRIEQLGDDPSPSVSDRVLNLDGRLVVPGFNDAHLHAVGESLLGDVLVGNPFEVEFPTIESIVARLRERAAQTPVAREDHDIELAHRCARHDQGMCVGVDAARDRREDLAHLLA